MEDYKGIKNFDELLDKKYGEIGTEKRNDFEERAHMFVISEMLKQARKEEKLTQEQLAERTGTKKVIFLNLKMRKEIFNFQH